MWLILFGIALVLCIGGLILFKKGMDDVTGLAVVGLMVGIIFFCFLFVLPIQWYRSRGDAWNASTYYQEMIKPNEISEDANNIYISNLQTGIWQSGDYTVVDFNSYIRQNRYWEHNFIGQFFIYPVPTDLKYVVIK